MDAVAIDLDGALGDTRPLWRNWGEDVSRRVEALETGSGALERLLERLGAGALVVRSAAELSVQSQRA